MRAWAGKVERILLGGFGEEILTGFFIGMLEDSGPLEVYECIRDHKSLLNLPEGEWKAARSWAKKVDVGKLLTREKVLATLSKERSDIASVFLNSPKGIEWIDWHIAELREKLNLTPKPAFVIMKE